VTIVLPSRFRDARRIGHGGMGDILLATDTRLDRQVVIKLLAERFAQDDDIRPRFTREALAAARLSSAPNTVTIFDVGETESGRPFIVMEYLSGGSLDDRLKDGPVEPEQALEWLEQAARALDAAHAGGIVHRDVKPANLLLDADDTVHVADFGVARATDLESLTLAGTVVGTAGYLSPEQARGEPAGPASDRYALGVLAFELLTGRRPYERDTTAAEAAAHVHEPVPSIHDSNPALPPALDRTFKRALAKDPADRFESSAAFVSALRDALAEPTRRTQVAAPPPLPPGRGPAARRARHPWRLPALIGLLAAIAIVGALLAAALVGDDEGGQVTQSVVTRAGERVTVTETVEPPPPPPPPPATTSSPPPAPAPPASGASGQQLTDQSTALMRQGRFEEALPIAQQALSKLQGSGELYEAYANYNVGRSLIELGRCEEGLPYIAASEEIQGSRREFREARAKCSG
jgi:serine/threonine-protein kinase